MGVGRSHPLLNENPLGCLNFNLMTDGKSQSSKYSGPGPGAGESIKPVPPDQPTVASWVKRDLEAAHYFLGVLLRYPEIMESVAQQIIDHVNAKENGAAIDKMNADGKTT